MDNVKKEQLSGPASSPYFFEPAKDPRQLQPLVLAYIGDAVYEVFVREYVIAQANHRPNHLHRLSTRYVSAKAQAKALDALLPILTEEEQETVKRGRNAKSGTSPKNTDILVYRHSTAFECLLGYLHYSGRQERLVELMDLAVRSTESISTTNSSDSGIADNALNNG